MRGAPAPPPAPPRGSTPLTPHHSSAAATVSAVTASGPAGMQSGCSWRAWWQLPWRKTTHGSKRGAAAWQGGPGGGGGGMEHSGAARTWRLPKWVKTDSMRLNSASPCGSTPEAARGGPSGGSGPGALGRKGGDGRHVGARCRRWRIRPGSFDCFCLCRCGGAAERVGGGCRAAVPMMLLLIAVADGLLGPRRLPRLLGRLLVAGLRCAREQEWQRRVLVAGRWMGARIRFRQLRGRWRTGRRQQQLPLLLLGGAQSQVALLQVL